MAGQLELEAVAGIGKRALLCSIDFAEVEIAYAIGRSVYIADQRLAKQEFLRRLTGEVTSMQSSQGQMLAVGEGGQSPDVHILDPQEGSCIYNLSEHDAPVSAMEFSQDGRVLATAGEDGKLIAWDMRTGNIIASKPIHKSANSIAFHDRPEEEEYLMAIGFSGAIIFLSLAPKKGEFRSVRQGQQGKLSRTYTRMCFSDDGISLFAGTDGADICRFNTLHATFRDSWPTRFGSVTGLLPESTQDAFNLIAACSNGALVQLSPGDANSKARLVSRLSIKPCSLSRIRGEGRALALSSASPSAICVVREEAGEMHPELVTRGHAGSVTSVAIDPMGSGTVVSAGEEGMIFLWEHGRSVPFAAFSCEERHAGICSAVAINDGTIVTGWESGLVLVHNEQGERIRMFPNAHNCRVTAACFFGTEDSNQVATADDRGHIRAWSIKRWERLTEAKGHQGAIVGLYPLQEQRLLVSASKDGNVIAWGADSASGHLKAISSWEHRESRINGSCVDDEGRVVSVTQSRGISLLDLHEGSEGNVGHREGVLNSAGSCVGSVANSPFIVLVGLFLFYSFLFKWG